MKNIYETQKDNHDFFTYVDYDKAPDRGEVMKFCETMLPIALDNRIEMASDRGNITEKAALMKQKKCWHSSQVYRDKWIKKATDYILEPYDNI